MVARKFELRIVEVRDCGTQGGKQWRSVNGEYVVPRSHVWVQRSHQWHQVSRFPRWLLERTWVNKMVQMLIVLIAGYNFNYFFFKLSAL